MPLRDTFRRRSEQRIAQFWDDAIVPALIEYIRIPAKSPHFDRDWQRARPHRRGGEARRAVVRASTPLAGMKLEIVRLEGRTPCLFIDVPGTRRADTVLLYGHLDKQPEMTGWRDGPRSVDPGDRGRQALRPRRRRRRLCGVLRPRRAQRAAGGQAAAPPLRRS